jgi:putative spermidine/putrescine transport system substrate-binding protein
MRFPFSFGQPFQRSAFALLALALATVGGTGVASAQNNKVVMGIWGGSWGKFMRETINSFASKNGIDVVYVEANSNGLLAKVVAQRNSPQIDIFQGNETTMAQSKTLGISVPLDTSIVTNMKDIEKRYRKPEEALITAYWAVGFAYRSDEFKKENLPLPDSWTALLRPDLKKKICLIAPPDLYGQATLIGLARAMGSDQKDIGPVFGKLAALKANALTVVQNPGEAENLLRAKECLMYPSSPARAHLMNEKTGNIGFIVPKEAAVVSLNSVMLVKHGPNPKAAQKILNYLISVPVQEKMANLGMVLPTNTKAKTSSTMETYMGSIEKADRPSKPIDGELAAKELAGWTSHWTQAFAQ